MNDTRITFSFGQNWSDFLETALSEERIAIAKRQTSEFLGATSLEGNSFLDIGCGSGLFSFAAHSFGADRVVSFDVDPKSVACCSTLRSRAGDPPNWLVAHGSILDDAFLKTIEPADVVYSWGALHHTGRMWQAISNASRLVKPGGRFFIAIYNKLEYDSFRSWRGSHGWLRLKRRYNRFGRLGKRVMEVGFASKDVAMWLIRLRNPWREARKYRDNRGMSWWYDIVDWLGGYPYEFASAGEVFEYCHSDLGLELERLKTTSSIGCHQFLFRRPEHD